MKFWQYAIGVVLAILVFAAVVMADMTQYDERSTFSQNPFSLLGVQDSGIGGRLEFLESGEMFWIDDGAEVEITDKERHLKSGTMVVGGTFFETSKDSAVTNRLWFGDVMMYTEFGTTLVSEIKDEGFKVLTGGGSVELYGGDSERPLIIPAHSEVMIPWNYLFDKDPDFEYFLIRKELNLMPIQDEVLAKKLSSIEKVLAEWRSQFGHFAWNIPKLWVVPVGEVVQSLEENTLPLPALKQARRDFQEEMEALMKIQELEDTDRMREKVMKFRQRNLETSLLQRLLISLSQESKEWTWFEFAQKYWLPVVAPDAKEQSFADLWRSDRDEVRELIRAVMLMSHNERVLGSDEYLGLLKVIIDEMEGHPSGVNELSRLRREVVAILDGFPVHRSELNFALLASISEKELDMLGEEEKKLISIEIGSDVVKFVKPLINLDREGSAVIVLNTLWEKLVLPSSLLEIYSPEELLVISDIELVGVSGMTPAKARLLLAQQEEREVVNSQLDLMKDGEEFVESGTVEGIVNAKKLWEFLVSEGINIDITEFRTARSGSEVTTRFANTESGKRKISGVFDYGVKEFRVLTLGEESTENLLAHNLSRWIKLIGGKFDSGEVEKEEEVVEEGNGISQNAPQAILARKLTQEVLKELGVELSRDDVAVVSDDFQKVLASDGIYDSARLTAEYDLVDREFSKIVLVQYGKTLKRDGPVGGDDMKKVLGEMLLEMRQN